MPEPEVFTTLSDAEVLEMLFHSLRKDREIPDIVKYRGEGASIFYQQYEESNDAHHRIPTPMYEKIFMELIAEKPTEQPITFISLGCGEGSRELETLKRVVHSGQSIHYMGVDASDAMIDRGRSLYAQHSDIESSFITGDFTARKTISAIRDNIPEENFVVVALLDAASSPYEQAFIYDVVADITQPGWRLWIDCAVQEDGSNYGFYKLNKKYEEFLKSPTIKKFIMAPLEVFGINLSMGHLKLHAKPEKSTNSMEFKFLFFFEETFQMSFHDQQLTIDRGEFLSLGLIRVFSHEKMPEFIANRGFTHLETRTQDGRGEFLFVRNPES